MTTGLLRVGEWFAIALLIVLGAALAMLVITISVIAGTLHWCAASLRALADRIDAWVTR